MGKLSETAAESINRRDDVKTIVQRAMLDGVAAKFPRHAFWFPPTRCAPAIPLGAATFSRRWRADKWRLVCGVDKALSIDVIAKDLFAPVAAIAHGKPPLPMMKPGLVTCQKCNFHALTPVVAISDMTPPQKATTPPLLSRNHMFGDFAHLP